MLEDEVLVMGNSGCKLFGLLIQAVGCCVVLVVGDADASR